MRLLGAVLAGGQSRRFGSDKAQALLGGTTLLDHAVAALNPQCDRIVIVGRENGPVAAIPDRPQPGLGPLGGIAGALAYAAREGFDAVLTVPVDCVRLPANLRDLLAPPPASLAAQPVIGLWPVQALPLLDALLSEEDDRSVRSFARRIGARAVESDVDLPNINHPSDLDRFA
ncbi:MAG: molybdenum cofactor guanylyltransferase [Sphingopyxis terrae]|jgi:molybdopterin-guanine dinucleotide biosynthesis protein A|uniref:molybdenum cofactor guanylyltransferase n=1 Tax=Sphingopyxis terrae TaxID=33052 RepID=UPI003F7F72DE